MKIAHLADIHIRLKERHQEYQSVFDRLYGDLRTQEVDHIVLAGDIVHSKITMSPELFDMTRTFFVKLLEIAPVHLITGNHDMNMSNADRMDALHPIVDSIDDPNLYYYQHTGLYEVPNSNIIFGVNSLVDGKTIRLTKGMKGRELHEHVPKTPSDKIYIALYHGALAGCVLDNEYTYEDAKISPHTFDNFDYVMLGDIHKFQQGFRPDGSMAYSGSLIQQNHGESLDKGYLMWDIQGPKKFNTELRPIKNDFGFYTIRADGGHLPDLNLPEKTRMRVIWPVSASEISRSEVLRLNSVIQEKYNPMSVNLLFRPVVGKSESTGIEFDGMINVKDPNVQHDLLRKWSESENNPQPLTDALLKLDRKIHDTVAQSELEDFTNSDWKLKYISIENFMSYGPKAELDFEKTPGIVGLFGSNASGKSVIIDAILYAIFNKTNRDVKNEDLINKYTDSGECKVCLKLEIKGVMYLLERWSTQIFQKRSNNYVHTRTEVALKRETVNGEWENLTETQRTETEKIIRNAIGSYDDFLTTTLSVQNGSVEFVNQRSAARADNMLRILGLDIFTKKFDTAKELLRSLEYEVRDYSRDGELETIDTLKSELIVLNDELLEISSENNVSVAAVQKYTEEIADLKSKIKSDVKINESIEDLEADVEKFKKRLRIASERQQKIALSHDKLLLKMQTIEDKFILDNDALIELNEKKKKADEIKRKLKSLDNKIASQKRVLGIYKKDLESENKCPATSDPAYLTCSYLKGYVVKNSECKQLIVETKLMLESQQRGKLELKSLSEAIDVLETQEMIRGKLALASSNLFNLSQESSKLTNDIAVNAVSLKLATSKLNTALMEKDAIEMNIFLRAQIEVLEEQRQLCQGEVNGFLYRHTGTMKKIVLAKHDLEDREASLIHIDEIEEERIVYKTYCDAMHRNGIPVSVLRQYIPKVNYEINRMLSTVVPFGVYLKIEEDSTKIDIVMRYEGDIDDTRPASMASGMERLLINFSIRYALIAISNLNRPNVWIIDEGFGVLDSENLYSVSKFFENTREIFENIIIITHIEELKDVANWVFNIEKKDGISYVLSPTKNI